MHGLVKIFMALIAVSSFLFSFIVFRRNNIKKTVNQSLFLICVCVGSWATLVFITQLIKDENIIYFLFRLLHIFSSFVVIAYFLLIDSLVNGVPRHGFSLKIGFIFWVLLSIAMLLSPPQFWGQLKYFSNSRLYPKVYISKGGLVMVWFLLHYIFWSLYAGIILLSGFIKSIGIKRVQLKYILISSVLGLTGGGLNFFMIFDISVPPLGTPLIFLYIPILTYSIIRYRFLDLNILVRKSIIYSLLLVFILLVYSAFVITLQLVFQNIFKIDPIFASFIAAFILALTYRPLEDIFASFTDNIFFKRRLDYQKTLRVVSKEIGLVKENKQLYRILANTFVNLVKVENVSVFVVDSKRENLECRTTYPKLLSITKEMPILGNPLLESLKKKNVIQREELDFMINNEHLTAERNNLVSAKYLMDGLKASLCIAVVGRGEILGIINLGKKLSQDAFGSSELELFEIIASQAAMSIENIFLIEKERVNAQEVAEAVAQVKYLSILQKTNEELQKTNDELKKTQAELIQSNRLKAVGELAAGVGHEINNPLTGILGNSQLLLTRMKNNPEIKLKEYESIIRSIENSAQRCREIVRGLLDFSREGLKKNQAIEVYELLKFTLLLVKNTLENEKIHFTLDPGSPSLILGHPEELQQVFLNLISNSRYAIKQKSTSGGDIHVKIRLVKDNKFLLIIFEDNGIGISEDALPHIFEPFFSTKKTGEGPGLGLSTVYGIIKQHGGTITADSEINKGTTIFIELPVKTG